MTTATLTRTTGHTAADPSSSATTDQDQAVRTLRDLHARAGRLVAEAAWTPEIERAVDGLSTEIRRTVAEMSGAGTFEPSTPGDGTPPVVRFRELGVLHRRLTEVLRDPVDPDAVHRATIRTDALVAALAGTLA